LSLDRIDPRKVFESVQKRRAIGYFSGLSKEIIRTVRHFGCLPSQLQFLDFGMGWGNWCRMAQACGCTVYGTELSQARIEYAQKMGVRVIDYEEIAMLRFDFIHTEQVFEHLADPRATLAYLRGSLKTGGLLKIGVPDGGDIGQRLQKWDWQAPKTSRDSLNPVAPLEHINCFDRASLLRLAEDLSLEPVDIHPGQGRLEAIRRMIGTLRRHLNRFRGIRSEPGVEALRFLFRARSC
jgi:SAM-dependent methyltransferase